jgi:hypothetical protein
VVAVITLRRETIMLSDGELREDPRWEVDQLLIELWPAPVGIYPAPDDPNAYMGGLEGFYDSLEDLKRN